MLCFVDPSIPSPPLTPPLNIKDGKLTKAAKQTPEAYRDGKPWQNKSSKLQKNNPMTRNAQSVKTNPLKKECLKHKKSYHSDLGVNNPAYQDD